jgi:F0F1-type ATP synthase membrane subunit b/b'
MNLMGKLFIGLIFIMCIMFMCFSIAIYATHTNWKKRSDDLTVLLKEAETQKKQLQDARANMARELDEERSKRREIVANLETKVEELSKENKQYNDELTELNSKKEEGIAAVKNSHETMQSLRTEVDGLRKDLRKAQEDWAKLNSELVTKTDEAHELAIQLTTYRSVGEKLAQDYRDAVDVLKIHGLKPVPELYSGIPPKNIKGTVTEVRPNGLIEISVGEDSGLVKGHRLDVVRNLEGRSSYIGKIEVIRTEADRSAAEILREFRRGTVQRGDSIEFVDVGELTAK